MKNTGKYAIVFLMLLLTSGFVFIDDHFSKGAPPANLEKLPLVIGEWRGRALAVDDRVKCILETDYIISRDYADQDGRHVLLSVVYYPDNKIGFHNPESCNVGAGSHIVQKDVQSLTLESPNIAPEEFRVNRLILDGDRGRKVIGYFFVSGDYMTCDYTKFRMHMMGQQMGFRTPSGAQIQIHSEVRSDIKTTEKIIADFLRVLKPILSQYAS